MDESLIGNQDHQNFIKPLYRLINVQARNRFLSDTIRLFQNLWMHDTSDQHTALPIQ